MTPKIPTETEAKHLRHIRHRHDYLVRKIARATDPTNSFIQMWAREVRSLAWVMSLYEMPAKRVVQVEEAAK